MNKNLVRRRNLTRLVGSQIRSAPPGLLTKEIERREDLSYDEFQEEYLLPTGQ